MNMSTAKKVGKRLLQFGLPALIIGFFLYQVKNNWSALTAQSFHLSFWLLALAFLGFVCQEISYGLIWKAVLARLGARLGLRASLRIYLASEFVRYIPGNVWHVLTRIIWVGKYGVSRPAAFASMAIELITKLAAGVLVFAVSLLFWRDLDALGRLTEQRIVFALGVGTILALCIILYPPVLNWLLNLGLRVLKRDPIKLSLRYRDILLVTLAWGASWFVAGSAFFVLLLALWSNVPLIAWPICIGIYALAWDIGFVSFITPSGLGFREGAIVGLFALAFPLPGGLAAIMALLSRFVSTIAELLCVSIAYVSGGRPPRALEQPQEQAISNDALDSTTKTETAIEVTISDAAAEEPSASISREEQVVGE
jgi:glycosyltransferase 2 family protein